MNIEFDSKKSTILAKHCLNGQAYRFGDNIYMKVYNNSRLPGYDSDNPRFVDLRNGQIVEIELNHLLTRVECVLTAREI